MMSVGVMIEKFIVTMEHVDVLTIHVAVESYRRDKTQSPWSRVHIHNLFVQLPPTSLLIRPSQQNFVAVDIDVWNNKENGFKPVKVSLCVLIMFNCFDGEWCFIWM